MNFENITGVLNRDEMKRILAGSGSDEAGCTTKCISNSGTVYTCSKQGNSTTCTTNNSNNSCG